MLSFFFNSFLHCSFSCSFISLSFFLGISFRVVIDDNLLIKLFRSLAVILGGLIFLPVPNEVNI